MKTKIEQVFFTILGMIGFMVGLILLLALIEVGERFAQLFV